MGLSDTLQAIDELDLVTLRDVDRLGRLLQQLCSALAVCAAGAEQDVRVKLATVPARGGAVGSRVRARLVTVGLRHATHALRGAAGAAVAYRVELRRRYVVPAQQATRTRARTRSQRAGGERFDVLGGVR